MKRIRILAPFDGHMPGDEVEFPGRIARQYIDEGKAEGLDASADLSSMTVAQLRAYADSRSISLSRSAKRKADIRAAIDRALEARK